MTKLRNSLISLATLLVVSTLLVACVNNQVKPPLNSSLEARVTGRWDALIDRNFELAYLWFSPAYRNLFPLDHYLSNTGSSVNWLSATIKDIQFDDGRAEVKVTLVYRLDLPMGAGDGFGELSKDLDEIWLWVDGQWWYVNDISGNLL